MNINITVQDFCQSYIWGAVCGWFRGLGWSIVLSFCIHRSGGGVTERLTGGQRGKRQCQLITGSRKHYIIVERDIFQHLDLRICTRGHNGIRVLTYSQYEHWFTVKRHLSVCMRTQTRAAEVQRDNGVSSRWGQQGEGLGLFLQLFIQAR